MNGSSGIQSANGGAMPFTTTHWSLVLEAQGDTPAAQRALEILCRTYWRPLYGFVRRHGLGREEAQDLVQEFFTRLLEHRNLDTVRREKGRLRSYLLVSLKRFLATEQHRARGVKRYETGPHIPLDELLEYDVADIELAATWSADGFRRLRIARGNRSGRPRSCLSRAAEKSQPNSRAKSHSPWAMGHPGASEAFSSRSRVGRQPGSSMHRSHLRSGRTRGFLLLQHEVHRRRTTR